MKEEGYNMNNYSQMQTPQDGVTVKRLLLIATKKKYNDVYQRSYSLNANVGTLNKLEAVFNNAGVSQNSTITDNMLAQYVPDVIGLSHNPVGVATIPHGWQTQRVRFVLEVESPIASGILISYIQGFSEYYDPSLSGLLDPNMNFYINSITNVVKMVDPMNGIYKTLPKNTLNVVTDLAGGTKYEEVDSPHEDLKLLRPRDIVEDISALDMYSGDVDSVLNTTGRVGAVNETSDRANNDPMKYLTKTINSYIDSKNTAALTSQPSDILKNAAGLLTETNLMSIPFIFALHSVTGEFTPTTFTLNIMNMIDPNIQAKTNLIDNVNDIIAPSYNTMLDSDNTADMLNPTVETIKASNISQTINSIMLDSMLSTLDISFTNASGQPVVIVSDAKSFIEGIDITSYVNKAVSRIKTVLMPQITDGGQTLVEVFLHSDIVGDTNISISVNLQPPEVYRFPTFADSLYVPVIGDANTKAGTVQDFSNMFDLTYDHANNGII